jgi:hypothetical protein
MEWLLFLDEAVILGKLIILFSAVAVDKLLLLILEFLET